MKLAAVIIALAQGLIVVGLLALVQAVVQAFSPAWTLPFNVWWGMVLSLPGLAMFSLFRRF